MISFPNSAKSTPSTIISPRQNKNTLKNFSLLRNPFKSFAKDIPSNNFNFSSNSQKNERSKDKGDRFIPRTISNELKNEILSSGSKSPFSKNYQNTFFGMTQTGSKSEKNYQKVLYNELLEPNSPLEQMSNQKELRNKSPNVILNNATCSVRKIRYTSPNISLRSKSPSILNRTKTEIAENGSNEDNILCQNGFTLNTSNKIEKLCPRTPYKSIQYNYPIDNFYYNILDIWNFNKICVGNREGINIFTYDPFKKDYNRTLYSFEDICSNFNYSNNQPCCVKFISPNKMINAFTNQCLYLTDLEEHDHDFLYQSQIGASIYSICPKDENFYFLGDNRGVVKAVDRRQSNTRGMNMINYYGHSQNSEVCNIKFLESQNLLVSGGNDDKAIISDIRMQKILAYLPHNAAVKGIAFNKNGTKLATGGGDNDKKIKIWDLSKPSNYKLISQNYTFHQVCNLEFLNNEDLLSSFGYIGNFMALYHLNYEKYHSFELSNENLILGSMYKELYSNNNSNRNQTESPFMDSINDDGKKFDGVDIFEIKEVFEKHGQRIVYTAMDRDEHFVATTSKDGLIKIWDIAKYTQRKIKIEDMFGGNYVR